jgi:hypothetical protein
VLCPDSVPSSQEVSPPLTTLNLATPNLFNSTFRVSLKCSALPKISHACFSLLTLVQCDTCMLHDPKTYCGRWGIRILSSPLTIRQDWHHNVYQMVEGVFAAYRDGARHVRAMPFLIVVAHVPSSCSHRALLVLNRSRTIAALAGTALPLSWL